ncbi:hypothetical protein BDV23DRAFT_29158 [Aspergillus alliaceus]|uniref:Xylanolytic transcriptional activator regulatory domain-containing protein n=1 Tax=Petromyces alliaceus TaxID=209559 RepID=A0A5N7CI87_PETAA|nr:hypothetical protein BDV23DRAFT_29158 [Aspergillus alliaceus]
MGSICAFNGLPFFSSAGRKWIKAQTGEDVNLNQYHPPNRGEAPIPTIPLPRKEVLYEHVHRYKSSRLSQLFPFIDPFLFEGTIHAAYEVQSPLTGDVSSSRACIFAFMAVTSTILNESDDDGVQNPDDYAYVAYDLLASLLHAHSVTVDGLQALLMLCLYSQAMLGDVLSLEVLLSSATRFVFHLGGHISPGKSEGDNNRSLGLRSHIRNLFWVCYIFNQECSLRTGLPPNLDDANCDLTLPEAPSLDPQRHGGCPSFLISLIRLGIIQSQIYRRLYSVAALNQTDAELLATIRDLDELLEDWKLSIPVETRPTFMHRSTDVDMESSILQLEYHYCMATIHQASGRCITWTQNKDTRGLGSSLGISVEASRSLLQKLLHSEILVHRYNILFCLPHLTAAMIHLFCDILFHPLDPGCHADLGLMDMIRELMVAQATQLRTPAPIAFNMQLEFVKELSLELQRLARNAIRQAAV